MIERSTTLVLGAGASLDYGYPSGPKLVQRVMDLTNNDNWFGMHLARGTDVANFNRRLRGSDPNSIDAFLEANPSWVDIGKLAIAAALTVGGPAPFTAPTDEHLYHYLWTRLQEGASNVEGLRRNRLNIVTYNYDLSLERYLRRVVSNHFPELADASAAAIKQLVEAIVPIVHIHGDLSSIEDTYLVAGDLNVFRDFGLLRNAAKGLRIIHEGAPGPTYETAHEMIRSAESVHFLGFGYHFANLDRLDMPRLKAYASNHQFWHSFGGTAVGLGLAERTRIAKRLGWNATQLKDEKCLSYLRQFAMLE